MLIATAEAHHRQTSISPTFRNFSDFSLTNVKFPGLFRVSQVVGHPKYTDTICRSFLGTPYEVPQIPSSLLLYISTFQHQLFVPPLPHLSLIPPLLTVRSVSSHDCNTYRQHIEGVGMLKAMADRCHKQTAYDPRVHKFDVGATILRRTRSENSRPAIRQYSYVMTQHKQQKKLQNKLLTQNETLSTVCLCLKCGFQHILFHCRCKFSEDLSSTFQGIMLTLYCANYLKKICVKF